MKTVCRRRLRVRCLLKSSYSTMTYDDVARQMYYSMADHTSERVPNMVTKSLCPDDSFHKMTMHSLTETVKRNLNFESDWTVASGWRFRETPGTTKTTHRQSLSINSTLHCCAICNYFSLSFRLIDLDHRNTTSLTHLILSLMHHHETLSPYYYHSPHINFMQLFSFFFCFSLTHPQHHPRRFIRHF